MNHHTMIVSGVLLAAPALAAPALADHDSTFYIVKRPAIEGVEIIHLVDQWVLDGMLDQPYVIDRESVIQYLSDNDITRGVVHTAWEHPRIVMDHIDPTVAATDVLVTAAVTEYLGFLDVMHEELPDLRVGNWSWPGLPQWVPTSVPKAGPGVRSWDNISEADRQTLFDKWRDPAFDELWDEIDVFMPSCYDAYDESDPDAKSWFTQVTHAWIDYTIALTKELAAGKQIILHYNARFNGGFYPGRAIPREQIWETVRRCIDADIDHAVWGLRSASWYWNQPDEEKRARFRAIVTPELVAAGVDPDDDAAVEAYFVWWAEDTATWIRDQCETYQAGEDGDDDSSDDDESSDDDDSEDDEG